MLLFWQAETYTPLPLDFTLAHHLDIHPNPDYRGSNGNVGTTLPRWFAEHHLPFIKSLNQLGVPFNSDPVWIIEIELLVVLHDRKSLFYREKDVTSGWWRPHYVLIQSGQQGAIQRLCVLSWLNALKVCNIQLSTKRHIMNQLRIVKISLYWKMLKSLVFCFPNGQNIFSP